MWTREAATGLDVPMARVQPVLISGALRACWDDGHCVHVDTATGQVSPVAQAVPQWRDTWVFFRTDSRGSYALVTPANAEGDGTLWRLPAAGGAWSKVMTVPGLGDHGGPDNMVMRGFALKPGWEPAQP